MIEDLHILREAIREHIMSSYMEKLVVHPNLHGKIPVIACHKSQLNLLFDVDTHSPLYYIRHNDESEVFHKFIQANDIQCLGVYEGMFVIEPTRDYPTNEMTIYFI